MAEQAVNSNDHSLHQTL